MTGSSREHARRISGFVWQTMRDRGLSATRPNIEEALTELEPSQVDAIHEAATALAKGSDQRDVWLQLEALKVVSTAQLRQLLRSHQVYWRADKLFELAKDPALGPTFHQHRADLMRSTSATSSEAVTALRELCGSLAEDAEQPASASQPDAASNTSAPNANAPGSSDSHIRSSPSEPGSSKTHSKHNVKPTSKEGRRTPRQVKIYGKAAAITVEIAELSTEPPVSVVMVEGANAGGDGSYRWSEKLVFQVGVREMPSLLAVLLRWQQAQEFRFHGQARDKSLLMEEQDHGLYVELRATSVRLGVPVHETDRYAFALLVVDAMARNEPSLGPSEILSVARSIWVGPSA